MVGIGDCYMYGQGVKMNKEEAVKWYSKAADLGSYEAIYNLGQCYENGYGVEKNVTAAIFMYKRGIGNDEYSDKCREALKRLGY